MSRRTWLSLSVPLLLVGAWFLVTALVRRHVDGLIQHAVDAPLPEFRLTDRAGRTWTQLDLAGKRAVLHFFRSRCHSCDVEAPEIRAFEARLPADVVCLHVMTDAVLEFAPELTAATLQAKAFAQPVLMADAAFVDAFHGVDWSNVTPITYVVDARGTVRYGLRGARTAAELEQALAAVR
ncbi:MAG: TlpA family protein disulfide reductase [Planctomycetes bacterium]|nr:TlpA family protein disulfide reductase [Planctomycetota bacterium]